MDEVSKTKFNITDKSKSTTKNADPTRSTERKILAFASKPYGFAKEMNISARSGERTFLGGYTPTNCHPKKLRKNTLILL